MGYFMSKFLFVGGPLHAQVRDIYNSENIEPVEGDSTRVLVTVNNETVTYDRTDYSKWMGPHYRVAVFSGASGLIQQTIDETDYKPV